MKQQTFAQKVTYEDHKCMLGLNLFCLFDYFLHSLLCYKDIFILQSHYYLTSRFLNYTIFAKGTRAISTKHHHYCSISPLFQYENLLIEYSLTSLNNRIEPQETLIITKQNKKQEQQQNKK